MSYDSTVLARSPTLYLPMSAGSLHDATGNGYTPGPTPSAPHVFVGGGAGAISGDLAVEWGPGSTTGDWLTFARFDGIPVVAPYSYELWVRFDQAMVGTNTFGIQVVLPTGTLGQGELAFFVQNDMAGDVSLAVVLNDGVAGINQQFSDGGFSSSPYCWHHYVATYDGTSLRWYLDGVPGRVLVEPAGHFSAQQLPSAAKLVITGPMTAGLYVNHIAVYPTCLSGAAIAANYAAATPRQDSACFAVRAPRSRVMVVQ